MTENKLLGSIEAWFTGCRIAFEDHDNGGSYMTDRKLLIHILKGQHHMALQMQALTDASTKLANDVAALGPLVNSLIALHTDPAAQAAVDSAATAVASIAVSVEALTKAVNDIVNPPAAPPAA